MGSSLDPFGIAEAYLAVQRAWLLQPSALTGRMISLSAELARLQAQSWQRLMGLETDHADSASEYDERFQDEAWRGNPFYESIKEYYLLYTRWLEDTVYQTPNISDKKRDRAAFWMRQALNAMAPTNFFWTNPVAITRYLNTGGENLKQGIRAWLHDVAAGDIRMVADNAFVVGRDLGNTPGKVVFRNELLELIQYAPATEQVHATPIVLISPWINKYYLLDLGEKKSLIRYLVAQGYTVFVTSWRNPGPEQSGLSMDDYLLEGARAALETAGSICNEPVHAVGYCIGGTMLAALMAWYRQDPTGAEPPVRSWTLFATLTDFSAPGEIDVFIDPDAIRFIEEQMRSQGYLDGKSMAGSFRSLRANSLIWHYFVHNYLYGEELPKFDVLFWNSDSTRMPATMHSTYLREFYLHNRLVEPGGVMLGGRALDLRKIDTPLYAVGAEQDHIAPWRETFRICGLVKAPVRYVLATSGHILGIVNPPVDPPKRRYWAGDATATRDAERWRDSVEKRPGSWWEDWTVWLNQRDDRLVNARQPGSSAYPPLDDAPGTYVFDK